ncbi:hypothetical protein MVEN_02167300 [Mycena venus]|uniref:DUF6593 domain-containing protein n=1 Tax=Mycena venus TaxID=2733690 RepID=A0A8H6X852_9AGAR|nr:hypothetical protein MVEN_02167300 [Mycena venus]
MPPVHTNHNPYDGWSRSRSGGQSYSGLTTQEIPPSVFGALPYPTPPSSASYPSLSTFYLTSLNPSVLNCAVIGPGSSGPRSTTSRLYYAVSTDSSMPGYTVFKNAERKSIALIEWTKHPRVEIRGAVPKQETKGWLKISRDQTYRTMTVRGLQYTWAPDNQYINLCSSGPTPQFLGRISRGEDTVAVELTTDAIQLGLQDTAIVVAVLLQCGHNID